MFGWPGPGTIPHGGSRVSNELRWFALTGRVIAVQAENDGDVHMVLVNANDEQPGKVIAEIPLGMRWCALRTTAFSWTNALFPFSANFKFNPFRLVQRHVVTLVGKAFYDTDHSGKDTRVNRRPRDKDKSVWDIHPIMSMQVVDPIAPVVVDTPRAEMPTLVAPAVVAPTLRPPSAQEFVTITHPVTVKIPYGTTVLPVGLKLHVISRDSASVHVRYLGELLVVPLTSTDLK